MKAINVKIKKALVRADSCAPHGERADWMSKIEVGTQTFRLWLDRKSIAWKASSATIKDLFANDMFKRRFNIMQMFLKDAPAFVPELVDALIWRSCNAANRSRHTNYLVKHVVIDLEVVFERLLIILEGSRTPK